MGILHGRVTESRPASTSPAWLFMSALLPRTHKDQSPGASAAAPGELPQAFTHLALIEAVSMQIGERAERPASTASCF